MTKEVKTYPDRWCLPFWKILSPPRELETPEKSLGVLLDGAAEPVGELLHVESGRRIRVRRTEKRSEHWLVVAKGLTQSGFPAGDRFLSSDYPATWENEAIFLPQGAMNSSWEGSKATLVGALVRHGGIPVTVRNLPQEGGKYLLHIGAAKGATFLVGAVYTLETAQRKLDAALVAHGPFKEKDIPMLERRVFRFPGLPSVKALYAITLRHRGWSLLPPELGDAEFEEAMGEGPVRVLPRTLTFLEKKLLKQVKRPGGLKSDDLQKELGLPVKLADWLLGRLAVAKKLSEEGGVYRALGNPEDFLSPLGKGVLQEVRRRGEAGVKPNYFRTDSQRTELSRMGSAGLAVPLEEGWYMDPAAMERIFQKLKNANDGNWLMGDLRKALETSRACLLAVLSELERRGLLVREGNRYRVLA